MALRTRLTTGVHWREDLPWVVTHRHPGACPISPGWPISEVTTRAFPIHPSSRQQLLDQPPAQRMADRRGPVVNPELAVDVLEVGLDRRLADHQLGRDPAA